MHTWMGTLAAALAILVPLGSLAVNAVRPRGVELAVDVLESNELTSVGTVPNLAATFKFKDAEVKHLWRVVFRVSNIGGKTIVCDPKQNMVLSNIQLEFPDKTEVLSVDIAPSGDPLPTQATPPPPLINVSKDASSAKLLTLSFEQLRRGESADIVCFVKTEEVVAGPLKPIVVGRPIVDGDITVNDKRPFLKLTRVPWFSRQPGYVRWPILSVAVLSMVLTLVFSIYLLFSGLWFLTARFMWNRQYLSAFREFARSDAMPNVLRAKFPQDEPLPHWRVRSYEDSLREAGWAAPLPPRTDWDHDEKGTWIANLLFLVTGLCLLTVILDYFLKM